MAKMNPGKVFEDDFRKSIPEGMYCFRVEDKAQSWEKAAKFTRKNPYDFILFDSAHGKLICAELKSTKAKSMTFDRCAEDAKDRSSLIHWHQIDGLSKAAEKDGVLALFVLNFRPNENVMKDAELPQRTYVMRIQDFMRMVDSFEGNKHSFNESDIVSFGAVGVDGMKKRTRYTWDFVSGIDKL